LETKKTLTPTKKLTNWLSYKLKDKEVDLYHNEIRIRKRYVDLSKPIGLIEKKLIETKRVKYIKDKDGELRTIKGKFMSKKDILRI